MGTVGYVNTKGFTFIMAWRFRAHMRYTPESGMAQWGVDQMQVRMQQAYHLNPGTPAEEESYAIADPDGTMRIDAIWPDDRYDLCEDTQSTFATTGPWCYPDNDMQRSWMETHRCWHDEGAQCSPPMWGWNLIEGEWGGVDDSPESEN